MIIKKYTDAFSLPILFIFLFIFTFSVYAEDQYENIDLAKAQGFALDNSRYYTFIVPKILEDGLQNDFSFGLFYTDEFRMYGAIRLRTVKEAQNDKIWDIGDSLLSRERQVNEVFFLPINYLFIKTSNFSLQAGAGLYYEFNKLHENGYFNDADLYLPPGEDRYNSFTNDYLGHSLGPLLDISVTYKNSIFRGAFSFGIVPVFYFNRNQTWKLYPYMNPFPAYSVASENVCGPYFFMNLDLALNLKYFTILLSLLNENSFLKYTAAGFTPSLEWADVSEEIKYIKFALEISILIKMGNSGIYPQIGYGRIFDEVTGGENYLLLGVKKEWY